MNFAGTEGGIKFCFALFIVGTLLLVNGLKRLLKARRLQDAARYSIAYAPQGNIEIEAFAWSLEQPEFNSQAEYCAYYRFHLEKKVQRGKNSRWEVQWKYEPDHPFIAVDKTGAVIVFAQGADLHCQTQITNWSDVLLTKDIHKIVQIVQAGYGHITTGFFSGSYRIVEEFITLGSPCYVQGFFSSQNSKKFKIDKKNIESFYEYLKKRPPGEIHQNLKFDQDGDGTVTDKEAAESLYTVAKNIIDLQISPKHINSQTSSLNFFGHIRADADHKLIIGSMHEHHFIKAVGSLNILRIIGGALMVSTAIGLFFGSKI
jgi:hypothetical protein